MMRLLLLIVLISALALWSPTGQAQQSPAQTKPAPEKIEVEIQELHSLPGHVVGFFVFDSATNLRAAGRQVADDAIAFSTGGGTYRYVFWNSPNPLTGETLEEPVGKTGNEFKRFVGISAATATEASTYGLKPPFTLADIEVDGGVGAPAKLCLIVATKITVLQKTDKYPFDPTVVMQDAVIRMKKQKQQQAQAIDRKMPEVATKALGSDQPTGPREVQERMFVTWLPASEHVQIRFRTIATDGKYSYGFDSKTAEFPGRAPPPQVKDLRVPNKMA